MRPPRALEGVERLDLNTTLRLPDRPPVQRKVNERTFRGQFPCPGGCREGGYDLGSALLNAGLSRHRDRFDGTARCKGFTVNPSGARAPCPGEIDFKATVRYAFGW